MSATKAATAQRSIALCADDFGLHCDVDGAILDLVQARRVTTVSCLVGGATWRRSGPKLAPLDRDRLETGLHLDLTLAPLAGARPCAAQSLWSLIARAQLRLLSRRTLEDQVARQLEAFEQTMHRAPDHVDGHQHVHQLPIVRDALLEVLDRRYPGALPWLRSTQPGAGAGGKARLIERLGGAGLRRAAALGQRATSGRLLGVHGFDCDAAGYLAKVAGWLHQCRDGDVLMCHPGWPPGAADDPLRLMRGIEWQVLGGEGMAQCLEHEQVVLAPLTEWFRLRQQTPGPRPAPQPAPARPD
jgi:predicted glycoside hydrolase/deacetylase ChbG (UPF0249 family)